MKNKTRSMLKIAAIVLVALAVLLHLSILVIPELYIYKFWIVVIGFALLAIAAK